MLYTQAEKICGSDSFRTWTTKDRASVQFTPRHLRTLVSTGYTEIPFEVSEGIQWQCIFLLGATKETNSLFMHN